MNKKLERSPQLHFEDDRFAAFGNEIINQILDNESIDSLSELFLPFISLAQDPEDERSLSITILSSKKDYQAKFLYEMTRKWLVPGQILSLSSFLSLDFTDRSLMYSLFTLSLRLPKAKLQLFAHYKDLFFFEVEQGLLSQYQANTLLEMKGISNEEKLVHVHEYVLNYLRRFPSTFDFEIISFMQSIYSNLKENYKRERSAKQIVNIIVYLYLLEKTKKEEEDRILHKHKITTIQTPFSLKQVFSSYVCIPNFGEDDHIETLELFSFINDYLPGISCVDESLLIKRKTNDRLAYMYFELEKEERGTFSPRDISFLSQLVPLAIKRAVNHLVKQVERPKNDEALYKNLLVLSNEVTTISDKPQVIISTGEKHFGYWSYNISIVYVRRQRQSPPIKDKTSSFFKLEVEKCKLLGPLEKGSIKEGMILHLQLFEMEEKIVDPSLVYFDRRKKVLEILKNMLGDFRDFNGGMIENQMKKLDEIKSRIKSQPHFLGKFFNSLIHKEYMSTWDTFYLVNFYDSLVEFFQQIFDENKKFFNRKYEKGEVIIAIFDDITSYKEAQKEVVKNISTPANQLVLACNHLGKYFLGILSKDFLEDNDPIKANLDLS